MALASLPITSQIVGGYLFTSKCPIPSLRAVVSHLNKPMKAKEHYKNHLAHFYSWMIGDFDHKQSDFQDFLKQNEIFPTKTKIAIDLGAGHGIQSVALTNLGFDVIAIDFNENLLNELKSNSNGQSIKTIQTDICNVKEFSELNPELIVCCGDTITHLDNKEAIETLIADCKFTLT